MKRLEKGFTLIELMIVVAIIAILAAVAAPRFGSQIAKARDAKAIETVGTWRSALNMSYADNQVYEKTFGTTIQAFVDGKTKDKTYSSTAKAAIANQAKAYTDAGSSGLAVTNIVEFVITGTSIESTIEFTAASGNDTKGTSWAAY